MLEEFAELDSSAGYPVELDDAAAPDEWLVAVKRIIAAAKGDQGTLRRWDFDNNIVNVLGRAQQAEAAARLLPP